MQVRNLKYNLSGDVAFGQYALRNETSIQIIDGGELICTATVNLEAWGVNAAPRGRVWLKTWAENEGIDEALIRAGVCERFDVAAHDREIMGGYNRSCRAVCLRLTPAALAELDQQELGR